MSIEKRVRKLEEKYENDNNIKPMVVICQFVSNLADKSILERHNQDASKYIKAHPEIWDSVDQNMKVLVVYVNESGWKINH